MKKISVVIAGRHSTSICLEEEFLHELKRIALIRNKSINDLVTEIDRNKKTSNLSSAIRLFVLDDLKNH
ncbi:MAG: ribbon-helix-helix domain-containing protein [bacterium]|nr:ribbon-helix-helix domain-containing protein [bacterium]MDY2830855.1 ribbon-helix-helix domain-containing protein [Alphaproteobacteria bacterium]